MTMDLDLKNWMGQLSSNLKERPLVNLTIPGSHDSMSYSITRNSDISPDSEEIVKRLMSFCGFVVRPIVYNWCITQKCNVTEQLELGIRYFDIRLATKKDSSDIFFVHGLYGDSISGPLSNISSYLAKYPSEVVILDMQHFYDFNIEDHQKSIDFIKNHFKNNLCPCPKNVDQVTLKWLNDKGYQVIVIYRNKIAFEEPCVWPSISWPTPWPQTMSPTYLIKFLSAKLHTRPKNAGFVSQCVLTPTNKTVFLSPFSTVEKKCAVPAARATLPWISDKNSGSINVCIADFIHLDDASFSKAVIQRNFIFE